MKTLKDVKKIEAQIRWDLTPLEVLNPLKAQSKGEKVKGGYLFYIDVWGCKASLGIIDNNTLNPTSYILLTDIPEKMLSEAVFEQGGALIVSGYYAINKKIEEWIKNRLKELNADE